MRLNFAFKFCGLVPSSSATAATDIPERFIYARIFYRNAINIGLAILECPEASEKIDSGDEVAIDFDTGVITNLTKGETYQANPFPDFIKKIIQAGGLMADIKNRQEAK